MSNGEKRYNIAPEGRGRWHTAAEIRAAAAEGVRVWLDVGRRVSRHQRPDRHRLTQATRTTKQEKRQRGHRKNAGSPLFCCGFFAAPDQLTQPPPMAATGSQGTPPAPQIVTICTRLSRLHVCPRKYAKHTETPQEAQEAPPSVKGVQGTPAPKEKRQQQPLKWQRDGRDQRQPPTRARAFIPRQVVNSNL